MSCHDWSLYQFGPATEWLFEPQGDQSNVKTAALAYATKVLCLVRNDAFFVVFIESVIFHCFIHALVMHSHTVTIPNDQAVIEGGWRQEGVEGGLLQILLHWSMPVFCYHDRSLES